MALFRTLENMGGVFRRRLRGDDEDILARDPALPDTSGQGGAPPPPRPALNFPALGPQTARRTQLFGPLRNIALGGLPALR